MGDEDRRSRPGGTEQVRCLECGSVYAKPATGGAVERNPGCPACGYVGWIPLTAEAEPQAPRRSGGGLPLSLAARWR